MTPEQVKFVQDLPLVHEEAMRLGLYETAHALHEAVKKSGYELARLKEKQEVKP